jgi:hypothetical protein
VRFEPTITASERAKTVHALYGSATVTGSIYSLTLFISHYSKTSVIRMNWQGTYVQIGGSPNYINGTENLLREVIKWTSRVFLGNTTLF